MERQDKFGAFFCLGFVIGVIMSLILIFIISKHTIFYKWGQIDALTGKVKFELVTQPDSTRTWEKIK